MFLVKRRKKYKGRKLNRVEPTKLNIITTNTKGQFWECGNFCSLILVVGFPYSFMV